MAALLLIGILYFTAVVWAGMLWGAIFVLERGNPFNRFVYALLWSVGNLAAGYLLVPLGVLGIVVVIGYFVVSVWGLVHFYELNVFKALGVMALMVATPFVVLPELGEIIGDSLAAIIALIYGLPTAILALWLFGRRRLALWLSRDGSIPTVRVVAERTPPPVQAEPVMAPIRPSQLIVPRPSAAPIVETPAEAAEGPRFLR